MIAMEMVCKFWVEFDNFIDSLWKGFESNMTKDDKFALVEFYGEQIFVRVPSNFNTNRAYVSDGNSISCNCNDGESGCTIK